MSSFVPLDHAELSAIRAQKARGWSLARIADYWTRSAAEIDLILWWMIGSGRKRNITDCRNMMNRRLAKMAAAAEVERLAA